MLMTDVESLFVCCMMCCTEAKGDSCSAVSNLPCLRGCRICFTSSLGHIGLLRNTAVPPFFQQVRNRHGANGTLRDGVHPLCCILKQALLLKLILVNSMIFSHRNVCLCECVCVYGMTAVLLHFAPHVRLISELHCHDTACITCLYTCTYAFTADEWAGVCSFETTLHFVLQLK